MEKWELANITVAVIVMFVIFSLGFIFEGDSKSLISVFAFSVIVVGVPIISKKVVAYLLDADVEHRIWHMYRYGWRPKMHFDKEMPFGVIVPFFFSLFTLGVSKVATLLEYETRALKHRAAKRFGHFSYRMMTDWHNGLIGAAGVVSLLLISFVAYFPGLEYLSKMAAYYAFWNIIPVSKLDGMQIFFGNRIVWVVLFVLSLIFAGYALVLPA
jgi:hypothetical protein